jgi:hypothetical protein
MTFVVKPSRNPMLNAAWSAFKKEQRAEKKGATAEPANVHTKPAKPAQVRADVHKKAGKLNNPAAKVKRGGRK